MLDKTNVVEETRETKKLHEKIWRHNFDSLEHSIYVIYLMRHELTEVLPEMIPQDRLAVVSETTKTVYLAMAAFLDRIDERIAAVRCGTEQSDDKGEWR
jgi:hypothetical protein